MMINDIVENETDKAKNRNISPIPIVFKSVVLSFSFAYKKRTKISIEINTKFRVIETLKSSGRVFL